MPPESPRRPTPGWRGPSKPVDRAPAAQPGWKKQASGWQRDASPPTTPWRLSRGSKFGIAFGSVLGLVVALAVLIYFIWPPQPAALILAGAGYETNLSVPHNAHGWRGLTDLQAWNDEPDTGRSWFNTGRMRLLQSPLALKRSDDWAPERWGTIREKTLVVVLALHGAANARGPYVLLDAPQDGQRVALPLSEILDGLDRIPNDRHLVLILDTTGLSEHWASGFLHNGFVPELQKLDERIRKRPNFVVLAATGDLGQRSWTSDEWGRTIFLHYLIEGLRGAADKDANGRLNVLELHRYVAARVERWSRDNRGEIQTPLLLPSGSEGETRAQQIDLLTVSASANPETSAAEAPHRELPAEQIARLNEAWTTHDVLKDQSPPPASLLPVVWRQYEATLLRCEQLVRAGAAKAAEPLFGRLTDLQREMEQVRRLDLESHINSLSMSALTGETPTDDEQTRARKVFELLWDAPQAQRVPLWAQELEKVGGDAQGRLRFLLAGRLIERATREFATVEDVEKSHEILRTLDGGRNERPLEVHVLALYAKDLKERKANGQPPPSAADLRLVLETCRRAEETALSATRLDQSGRLIAPYAEQVHPWVHDPLNKADALRRKGENLLFGSDATTWDQARGQLTQANAAYQAVRDRGEVVRRARAVCDEAAAWLPWYAHFRSLGRSFGPVRPEDGLDRVENLASDVENLARLLEAPRDGDELARAANDAREEFETLRNQFLTECNDLTLVKVRQQRHWRDLDAVLQVPSIPAPTRQLLLENLRRTGQSLNVGTEEEARAETPQPDPRADAQRHGRMALAVLGDRWVIACEADNPAAPGELRNLIRAAPGPTWQASLLEAGERLGFCFRRMAGRIAEIHEKPNPEAPKAEEETRLAARLGLHLDGGQAWLLREIRKVPDPALELRKLHLRDYLHALADRTRADHWWSENVDLPPYYHVAGGRYLRDADKLELRSPELQKQREAESRKLANGLAVVGLVLENGSTQTVADEDHFVAQAVLKDDPRVPRGEMAVWLKTGEGVVEAPSPRTLREVGLNPQPYSVALKPGANAGNATVTVHARYRGQPIPCVIPVTVSGQPTLVVYRHPPAPGVRIAGLAPPGLLEELAWEQMRIAIVFDCSGSMYPGRAPDRRIDVATDALEKVLRDLPPGPKVSLWVLGHQTRDAEKAQRLLEPKAWTPNLAASVIKTIRAQEPDADVGSPIARTLIKAAERDLALNNPPETEEGARVLLLLTDGQDNRFAPDPAYRYPGDLDINPQKQSVADALRTRFDGRGIQVFVAGFELGAEEKVAREQFGIFEKIDPPGKFMTANSKRQLIEVLQKATVQQPLNLRAHEPSSRKPLALTQDRRTDLALTPVHDNLNPSRLLLPGSYNVRIPLVQPQQVGLNEGDVLVLEATRKGLGRSLFVDDQKEQRPGRSRPLPQARAGDWAVSVHQSHLSADERSLQMLVAAEKETGRFSDKGSVGQVRPKFVWFELRPQPGNGPPIAMTVRNVDDVLGYPAPLWRLDAPTWPNRSLPVVQTWLREFSPTGDPALSTTLRANEVLDRLDKLELRVAGEPISELKITFESQDVEERPNVISRGQKAMVVRLRHPPGSPVMARLDGLGRGEWHRFYSTTNQYTGVFWPVDENTARKTPFSLSLISIKALQANVKAHEVAVPDADRDLRPPRPLGLQGEPTP